jgi:hypothetical protein
MNCFRSTPTAPVLVVVAHPLSNEDKASNEDITKILVLIILLVVKLRNLEAYLRAKLDHAVWR